MTNNEPPDPLDPWTGDGLSFAVLVIAIVIVAVFA